MAQDALPLEVIRSAFSQLSILLLYLQRRGVSHGGVTPQNILLSFPFTPAPSTDNSCPLHAAVQVALVGISGSPCNRDENSRDIDALVALTATYLDLPYVAQAEGLIPASFLETLFPDLDTDGPVAIHDVVEYLQPLATPYSLRPMFVPLITDPGYIGSLSEISSTVIDAATHRSSQARTHVVLGGEGTGKSRLLGDLAHALRLLGNMTLGPNEMGNGQLFERLESLSLLLDPQPPIHDDESTHSIHPLECHPVLPGYDNQRLTKSVSLVRSIRQAHSVHPAAVVIDQLEMLRQDDFDLLRLLIAAPDGPVVVMAGRPDDSNPALAEFLAYLRTSKDVVFHQTSLLTAKDIGLYLDALSFELGDRDALVAHFDRLVSGSLILFQELVLELVADGHVRLTRAGWIADLERVAQIRASLAVTSFAESLAARIPASCKRLVEFLALMEAPCDSFFLASLLERSAVSVMSDLATLASAGVLTNPPGGAKLDFRIQHACLKEYLYAHINPSSRRKMHLRVADALSPAVNPMTSDPLYSVAEHYAKALDFDNGPKLNFLAATHALKSRLTHRAVDFLTTALDLTPPSEVSHRFEGLSTLARLHTLLGHTAKARDFYTEMLVLARRHANLTQEAVAVQGLAEFLTQIGDNKKGIQYSIESERLSRLADQTPAVARSIGTRAQAYLNLGELDLAERLAGETFALAETASDYQAQSYARNLQGLVATSRGEFSKAVSYFEGALGLKAMACDVAGVGITLNNLGVAYLERGLLDDAERYLGRALAESREKSLAFPMLFSLVNLGELSRDRAKPRSALPYLREGLALLEGTGRRTITPFALVTEGVACTDLGYIQRARDSFSQAATTAEINNSRYDLMLLAIRQSELYSVAGDYQLARTNASSGLQVSKEFDAPLYRALAVERAADVGVYAGECLIEIKSLLGPARQANRLRETMYLMMALARVHLGAGEARKALAPAREAIRLAQTGGLTLYELRAAQLEGRALLLLGRPAEAARVLEAAATRMEAGELRPLQADTLYWLSQAQEASGDAVAAAQSTFGAAALVGAIAQEITDEEMRTQYLMVPLNLAVMQRAERLERSGLKPRLPSRSAAEADPASLAAAAHEEILRELGADAAPRRVLSSLLGRAVSALRADHGLLVLLPPEGPEVSIARSMDGECGPAAPGLDEGALELARMGTSSLSNDPSYLSAPLELPGEPTTRGALYFDSSSPVRFFRDHDLRLAEAFASRAASILEEAQESRHRLEKAILLNRELARRYDMTRLVGESPAMERLFRMMEAVVGADCNVLLVGESGTGKEMVARAIHYAGARKDRDFVTLNCGAVPDSLVESELFGHRKGAFSGADADRRGLFEEADGGTLFLDEIGNASPAFQAKLLRVLQSGELRRLGETFTRKVDARIIAATNADVEAAMREARFREDLYYRLNVVTLTVPPLRERREDIPLLAEHFARSLCDARGAEYRGIGQEALARLRAHDWPGNVRELEHAIEASLLLAKGGMIRREHLPDRIAGSGLDSVRDLLHHPAESSSTSTPPEEERALVERALAAARGDKSQAARMLGWSRMKLYRRLKALGIPYDAGRATM